MTNSEKYLKENVNVDEFVSNFLHECNCPAEDLEAFLNHEAKPTLSEGEKNILKSIGTRIIGGDEYGYDKNGNKVDAVPLFITRKNGRIKVCWKEAGETVYNDIWGKIFRFIKERRRI